MSQCAWCGYAEQNGHAPLCLAGYTVEAPRPPKPTIPAPWFDGNTFEPRLDLGRLGRQMLEVYRTMADGTWRTLQELSDLTDNPEVSVSARLRDLRKERWGSNTIERRRRGDGKVGLFEYRLVIQKREAA